MKVVPYLNFGGSCAEAFRFYEKLFGGKLEMMTHGESPMAGQVPPDWQERVMHAYLAAGEMTDPETYMCGPPPMIDAMTELLTERYGVDEDRIFHDKFTTAADAVVAE